MKFLRVWKFIYWHFQCCSCCWCYCYGEILINFSDRIDLVTRLAAVLEAPVIFEPWPPPSEIAHAATLQDRTRTTRHALGGGLWVQLQQPCSIKSEEAWPRPHVWWLVQWEDDLSCNCAHEHAHSSEGTTFNLYQVKVLEESLLLLPLPPPLLNSFICCLCTTVILAVCIRNYLVHHVNDHFINYYWSFVHVHLLYTHTPLSPQNSELLNTLFQVSLFVSEVFPSDEIPTGIPRGKKHSFKQP